MHQSIKNRLQTEKDSTAEESTNSDFRTLFHDPEIEFEVKKNLLEDLHQTVAKQTDQAYFDGLFHKFWNRRISEKTNEKSGMKILLTFARIAAVLVVGLLAGYYLHTLSKPSTPEFYTSVAPKGSVSELVLPDGTHIFLNSGSKINYTNSGLHQMREVFLSGEAWFQVAHNEAKPFLVHTSFYDVQVTGTSFNVKAYPDDNQVTTTLEVGSVHIISSKTMKISEETILKPGEQLSYNKETRELKLADVNTKQYTSWKDNKLIFINMTLKELAILLERKFGVEIEISDPAILNYHYDGTIKDETILDILDILKHTLPINYQIIGQKVVIQKK